MEGAGSRLGRVSSRYGPTPVFNGPVRKWKKQWVSSQPNNNATTNGGATNGGYNTNTSTLYLCRWTPLSSSRSDDSSNPSEHPKRKFRYKPVVTIEQKKKVEVGSKVEDEAKIRKRSQSLENMIMNSDYETADGGDATREETKKSVQDQSSNRNNSKFDVSLADYEHNQVPENKDTSGTSKLLVENHPSA